MPSNPYDLTPTHWNGNDLTAAPFASVLFDPVNGPMQNDWRDPVEASIVGVGDRYIRSQSKGANWDLIIELTSTLETDRLQLARIFSGEPGQVYLRAKDGDNNTLRALAMLIELERVDANHFVAQTRVADARWEDNDLQTTGATYNNKSGDSVVLAGIANSGDKRARPTLTVTPVGIKAVDPGIDFMTMERGFIVNRSPKPLVDHPVDVTDVAAASSPYNTATLVKVAGISNLLNQVGGITAAFTGVVPIDTPAGGGLLQPAGIAIFDDGANQEQVYYIAATATQIQIVTRGVGGTTARAWPDNTPVYLSWLLKDGSDLRVWMNGAWVERWLGGFNSSVTRIWVPVSAPARKKMTAVAAATVGSPANGGSLQIQEDISDMPDSGVLAWEQELIGYSAKNDDTRTFIGIQRAVWTSRAAASHATAVPVYRVDNLFAIAFGRAGLPPPLGDPSLERRPALQLKSSQNNSWRYGDESDDASTVFYEPARPNRLAMFQPDYTVPAGDFNDAIPLRLADSTTIAAWKDSDYASGKLQVGRLRLSLPVGIKPAASAITYDCQPRRTLAMRMLGIPDDGTEIEIVRQLDPAEAAVAAATVTPASRLNALILNAVRAATIGGPSDDVAPTLPGFNAAQEGVKQDFSLSHDTPIESVYLRMKKAAAGDSFNVQILISSTDDADEYYHFGQTSGYPEDVYLASDLTTASVWYKAVPTSGKVVVLKAGTYRLRAYLSSWGSGTFNLGVAFLLVGMKPCLANTTGSDVKQSNLMLSFALVHPGGGPVEAVMPLINEDKQGSFDKLILALDDTAGDPLTPYVDRETTAVPSVHNIYHCIGRLTNPANGKLFDIDTFMKLTFPLAVDTLAHSAIYNEANWSWSLRGVIGPSDASEWCPLEPGSQSPTYAEGKMLNTSLLLTHRGKRG